MHIVLAAPSTGGAVSFTYGAAADRVVQANGGSFGACGTNACHNNGTSITTGTPAVTAYSWNTTQTNCTTCHNDAWSTLATGSHTAHLTTPIGGTDARLCGNCHNPHGTTAEAMLKTRMPYLCQQCHQDATNHSNIAFGGQSLPGGASFNTIAGGRNQGQRVVGNSCTNCHMKVHGSNHPSGARFQR